MYLAVHSSSVPLLQLEDWRWASTFPSPGEALAQSNPEINAWVMVRPDETVVVRVGRVEMGQGTLTGLAQLVAEELECDWAKVTTEYPTPGQNVARSRVWGNFQTAGSRGVRDSHDYMRKGGAAARQMLIQAAANGWGVPAGECTVAKGVITHSPSGRTTSYGKVAEAASKLEAPKDVQLKDPKDWTIAGKPVKRLDTAEKLNGSQIYSIDVKRPGMLNAAIKACPVFGGKLKSFDAAQVQGMPGVKKVVAVGDNARRSRRRHMVACQDGARCPSHRMGWGAECRDSPARASIRCSRRD